MSRYRERYDGVPGGDFELMEEGKYPVKVIAAAVRPSKASGTDTWCLDLEIIGRRYAGRKLWLYISMKSEAAPVRKGTMTALGLDTSAGVDYDLIDDVVGRNALAEIYHDTYQGEKREKVKRLRSIAPEQTAAPVEADDEINLEDCNPDEVPF